MKPGDYFFQEILNYRFNSLDGYSTIQIVYFILIEFRKFIVFKELVYFF